MCEEWGIGSHVDDVAVALITCHEGCLHKGCIEVVPLLAFSVTCIFASENLRTLAVIVVIAMTIDLIKEPVFITIEVLIIQVNLQLFHLWLEQVELPTF